MTRKLVLVLSFVIFSGCAGETRFTKTGDHTFEVVMEDNGMMYMLNSSRFEQEWKNEISKICPNGYTIQNQTYIPEKAFEPARLTGIVTCK